MKQLFTIILIALSASAYSQSAFQHVSDRGIYQFLDELAAVQIIDVTSAIKPYTREQIAHYLQQAEVQWSQLSFAQRGRLERYMKEYALERGTLKEGGWQLLHRDSTLSVHLLPPEIAYRDTLFTALIRPVYGYRNFSGGQKNFWATYGGAEAITYIGSNWSVYASLRDNYQSGQRLAQPTWLTQEPGGTYKGQTGGGQGGEFSEMRGGITYSWNWGNVGLIKDHVQWGDHQNGSNIFSGRTPSFAMVKLHMSPARWISLDYFHGWLVSQAIDSVNSFFPEQGLPRTVQRRMYIAANMVTLKPWPGLHFSAGNSIVYGDMPVQPAYLIPVLFYKSVVHTLHWGSTFQNNALYFNLSSRQIKHLHLYASYFVDEFSIRRVTDPNRRNFTSFKGGMSLTDWPVRNVFLGGEYTFTNPITFLHDEPTTRFSSNLYNLGHYLQDNAQEMFAQIRVYPAGWLQLGASYTHAQKGNYYQYIRHRRNPRIDGHPVLDEITWEKKQLALDMIAHPLPNFRVFARVTFSDIQGFEVDEQSPQYYLNLFSPAYLHGKNTILELGFGLGF